MMRWLLVVAVVCAPAIYEIGSAEACSFPPPVDLREDLTRGLTGIPVSGVVPILASVWHDGISVPPTMTVQDPSGASVSGTLELETSRVIWRSDAPLTASTTYDATLKTDGFQQVEFTFTTGVDDSTPPLVISGGDLHLSEYHRPDERICCNSGESSCGGPWTECWTRSVVTEVELHGRFTVELEAARYYRFEGEAEGARAASARGYSNGEGIYSAFFVERGNEYCLTVVARSLLGAADVTETLCQNAAALEEADPFEPEDTNYSICDDPPYNPDTGEQIDTGGCNTGGGGGSAPILFLLVALGLIRRRWRRDATVRA